MTAPAGSCPPQQPPAAPVEPDRSAAELRAHLNRELPEARRALERGIVALADLTLDAPRANEAHYRTAVGALRQAMCLLQDTTRLLVEEFHEATTAAAARPRWATTRRQARREIAAACRQGRRAVARMIAQAGDLTAGENDRGLLVEGLAPALDAFEVLEREGECLTDRGATEAPR